MALKQCHTINETKNVTASFLLSVTSIDGKMNKCIYLKKESKQFMDTNL